MYICMYIFFSYSASVDQVCWMQVTPVILGLQTLGLPQVCQ